MTAALVPEAATAHYALRARQRRRAGRPRLRRRDVPPRRARACAGLARRGRRRAGAGDAVLEVTGPLRPILTAERTALNFLGHLSGIATLTAQFVAAAHESNPSVEVLDTRKTTPGLRLLEKAAVRAGGGTNHRLGLSDAVLVKDNHLAGITITDAVARARALWPGRGGRDRVRRARAGGRGGPGRRRRGAARQHGPRHRGRGHRRWPTSRRRGPILTEVSGGVTLATIGAYAAAGPDRISVGALTHSAPALDLGLDLIWAARTPRHARYATKGSADVLLVIDVGNTETVIGLYTRDDTDTVPVIDESVGVGIGTERDPTAPRGLTHHWRLSTVPTARPTSTPCC